MAVALLGEQTAHTGLARSFTYRWFTQPATRSLYPREDHEHQSQVQVADLRAAVALRPRDPQAAKLVGALRAASAEFDALWERHDVAVRRSGRKRIVHPAVGVVHIDCEVLATARQDQRLLVFTPPAGQRCRGTARTAARHRTSESHHAGSSAGLPAGPPDLIPGSGDQ
jgi:hypothetical protein